MRDKKEKIFDNVLFNNKDRIYRLCKSFFGDRAEADDLFQDILIKIWNNLDSFREESSINTWVYRIATNTALTYKREIAINNKRTKSSYHEYTNIIENSDIYQKKEVEVRLQKLFNAISKLKEIDRVIVSMILDELSYSEISEITGLSQSNVGVKIKRLKERLSKIIKTI